MMTTAQRAGARQTNAQRRDGGFFILAAVILLAFALRLLRLDGVALRGDEAFTIQYWPVGWNAALDLVGTDPHPWGAYALFGLWRGVFGDGVWIMRLLPALLSLPGVVGTYGLARSLFGSRCAGRIAALLYAVHPFLIWHAQDVRNYALWAAVSPLNAWAFWLALKHDRRRDWVLYLGTSALASYVFFLHPFLLAAQVLYVVLARRDRLRAWVITMLALAVLLIPWGVELLTAATSDYGGTAGGFAPLELLTVFLPTLAVGSTLPGNWLAPLGVGLILGLVAALIMLWRRWRNPALFLATQLLVPALILSVIALRMAVFRPRYIIAIVPFLLVLAAGSIWYLTTRKKTGQAIALIILLALGLLYGSALVNHYADPAYRKAPDWPPLGAFLTDHTQPGDLVVQQALDPAFTYYFRGPADETTLPLSANAPAAETTAILANAIATRRAVWLVPAEIPGYDDEQVPLTWLTGNTQTTLDVTVSGFRVLEFRAWGVPPEEYTVHYNNDFGGIAYLIDWQVDYPTPDTLRVILYWQPLRQAETPLAGFVHLVGPPNPVDGSPLWTQDDHPVPGGAADSTSWQPEHVYRDVYLLDLSGVAGNPPWSLHLGLYDPVTLDRVPIGESDYLDIPLVTVWSPADE